MASSQVPYRRDIDGLRAIAILAVVAYHARLPGASGGFIGVDVFFVISGYLITLLLIAEAKVHRSVSLRSFYARRIRRLFPALFVMVCISCLLGYFALLPIFDQQQDLARSIISASFYVSNIYFWLTSPGYFDASVDLRPLLHTWSLSVEEQFYLVWPPTILVILLVARKTQWSFPRLLLVLTTIVFAASFMWCVKTTSVHPAEAFYLLPSRAWELAIGSLLAQLLPRVDARSDYYGTACSIVGLVLIVLTAGLLTDDAAFPGHIAVLPVAGTALLIAGGTLAEGNPIQRALSVKPMVFIGLLSYSWYLWHWPLLALARAYTSGHLNTTSTLGIVLASMLIAYLSYRYVESPIRYRRRGPFSRPGSAIAVGIAMSVAMCMQAGALGAWAKYVGSREPGFARLMDARLDRPPLRSKCHQDMPFSGLNPQADCVIGRSTLSPTLFLWGDSHADHLSPLLQEVAGSTPGVSAVVRSFSGCAPVSRSKDIETNHNAACRSFQSAVMNEIIDLAAHGLRGVILSGRWLREFPPSTCETSNANACPVGSDSDVAASALQRLTNKLTSLGLRVLLVAPIPGMLHDVPACLARHDSRECGVPRPDVDLERRYAILVLNEVAAGSPDVQVFDPVDSLCGAEQCYAEIDGVVVYLDDRHLTATASRALLSAARKPLMWANHQDQ